MELKEVQRDVDQWIGEIGGYWDRFQILSRMTEELGEIAAALQREEGLRPRPSNTDLAGEIGDLLFTIAALANVSKIDLDDSFMKTMAKYRSRDREAWRKENRLAEPDLDG